jgi:aspartyl-tRNA(Asn)/glutamyl-tRNA(Gln) amidotransferase subunit C
VKIDASLVQHVANLANLALTPEEVSYYEVQLTKVLGYVAVLDGMPEGGLPSDWRSDTLGGAMPERPDAPAPSLPAEEALAAAPQRAGTAFQVPRIIE